MSGRQLCARTSAMCRVQGCSLVGSSTHTWINGIPAPTWTGHTANGALALKHMHPYGTLMHMRTTLIIDDELLAKAQQLTGLREKTAVLHAGLQALIARENGRRLAALGGSERSLKPIPRRRSRAA